MFTLGYPEQALSGSGEALAYARKLSHRLTMGISLFQAAGFCQLNRDRDGVLERAEELFSLATELGQTLHVAVGNVFRGWALAAGGDTEAGTGQLQRALVDYRASGGQSWLTYFPDATRSVEEGVETTMWLATLPDGGPSGQVFRDKQPIPWG